MEGGGEVMCNVRVVVQRGVPQFQIIQYWHSIGLSDSDPYKFIVPLKFIPWDQGYHLITLLSGNLIPLFSD